MNADPHPVALSLPEQGTDKEPLFTITSELHRRYQLGYHCSGICFSKYKEMANALFQKTNKYEVAAAYTILRNTAAPADEKSVKINTTPELLSGVRRVVVSKRCSKGRMHTRSLVCAYFGYGAAPLMVPVFMAPMTYTVHLKQMKTAL